MNCKEGASCIISYLFYYMSHNLVLFGYVGRWLRRVNSLH